MDSCPWPRAMTRAQLLRAYNQMKRRDEVGAIANVSGMSNGALSDALCRATRAPPFVVERERCREKGATCLSWYDVQMTKRRLETTTTTTTTIPPPPLTGGSTSIVSAAPHWSVQVGDRLVPYDARVQRMLEDAHRRRDTAPVRIDDARTVDVRQLTQTDVNLPSVALRVVRRVPCVKQISEADVRSLWDGGTAMGGGGKSTTYRSIPIILRERRTLADAETHVFNTMCAHANIAQLYGVALLAAERVVLALEWTYPTRAYSATHQSLTLDVMLARLSEGIATALEHLHQNGIQHNDVRVDNTGYALYRDAPVCKLVDFSRATSGRKPDDHTDEIAFVHMLVGVIAWRVVDPARRLVVQDNGAQHLTWAYPTRVLQYVRANVLRVPADVELVVPDPPKGDVTVRMYGTKITFSDATTTC